MMPSCTLIRNGTRLQDEADFPDTGKENMYPMIKKTPPAGLGTFWVSAAGARIARRSGSSRANW